jgi:hypothetical protein
MVFKREDGFQPFKQETLIKAGVFRDKNERMVAAKLGRARRPPLRQRTGLPDKPASIR